MFYSSILDGAATSANCDYPFIWYSPTDEWRLFPFMKCLWLCLGTFLGWGIYTKRGQHFAYPRILCFAAYAPNQRNNLFCLNTFFSVAWFKFILQHGFRQTWQPTSAANFFAAHRPSNYDSFNSILSLYNFSQLSKVSKSGLSERLTFKSRAPQK